ncbi:MAG: FtsW/RodA/SpoVE family cell cycle protein [Ruminiclostridium sp.]
MSKYVTSFIDTVLVQIKYKKAHNTISEELNNHICELAEGYMTEGMEEEEAFCKAVIQMGDPVEIGKRLHKTHKPKTEWSVIALLAFIVVYGLYIISIYSSVYNSELIDRQIFFVPVGIFGLAVCCFFDYARLEKYSIPAYFITCLLHFLLIIFGSNQRGRTYITIFGFGFNPSLMLMPILLICYAGLVKKWCDGQIRNIIKLLAASALPLFLILLEPAIVNMLIIGAGFLTILTFGICGSNYKGNRRKTLLIIYGSLCAEMVLFFIYFFIFISYRTQRLTIFLNPQNDPLGAGYINIVLDKILSSAKLFGNSKSLETNQNGLYYFLGSSSEFIFTFVVGQLGWIFGILLIALFCSIIFRLFIADSKVEHEYGKYLCVGICCVFSLQVIINILVNLGLIPILNVALPFITHGGASYLMNMSLLGLFLGIYRRKDITFTK